MLKKNVRFQWTPEKEKAFLDLKSRLATQPILRPPDYTLRFCLAVDDASGVAISEVLLFFRKLITSNTLFAIIVKS